MDRAKSRNLIDIITRSMKLQLLKEGGDLARGVIGSPSKHGTEEDIMVEAPKEEKELTLEDILRESIKQLGDQDTLSQSKKSSSFVPKSEYDKVVAINEELQVKVMPLRNRMRDAIKAS